MIVIIKEEANGNESVGTMWLETKIFPRTATIEEVLKWKGARCGKLIITEAQTSEEEVEPRD